MKYTLTPWSTRWEQAIHRALFSETEKKRFFVRFNVEGLLRGDYASRMGGYAVARQNGWMSANDIRELEKDFVVWLSDSCVDERVGLEWRASSAF